MVSRSALIVYREKNRNLYKLILFRFFLLSLISEKESTKKINKKSKIMSVIKKSNDFQFIFSLLKSREEIPEEKIQKFCVLIFLHLDLRF